MLINKEGDAVNKDEEAHEKSKSGPGFADKTLSGAIDRENKKQIKSINDQQKHVLVSFCAASQLDPETPWGLLETLFVSVILGTSFSSSPYIDNGSQSALTHCCFTFDDRYAAEVGCGWQAD